MPTTTTQTITPLILAGLAASTLILAVAAWKMRKAAQEWRRIAEDAIAANREREWRAVAAAQAGQTAQTAASTARLEEAIAHLRTALESMQTAAARYRDLSEMLTRQLQESQNELEDWQTAVRYHLETIAGLTAERDQIRGQLATLQHLYASRTQAALRAGLTRFVVGDDAGFTK